MDSFDKSYDEDYTLDVERAVEEIRAEALKPVRKTHPDIHRPISEAEKI